MKNVMKMFLSGAVWLVLSACSLSKPEPQPVNTVPLFQEEVVALQNPDTRVLVYCFSSGYYTAEACAAKFEKEGFVKLKDIPKFPAEDDFLQTGTYPTRRWRSNERVPRW